MNVMYISTIGTGQLEDLFISCNRYQTMTVSIRLRPIFSNKSYLTIRYNNQTDRHTPPPHNTRARARARAHTHQAAIFKAATYHQILSSYRMIHDAYHITYNMIYHYDTLRTTVIMDSKRLY